MAGEFARYRVTGTVVDNGDWVLVPVELESASVVLPGAGDLISATFQGRGGVQVLNAGFGLTGGGAGGAVTIAVDSSVIATAQALAEHTHEAADVVSGQFAIQRIPVGSSSTTVCAGNDGRLSDERTPINGSVTTAKLAAGAVTQAKIGASAVGTSNIADGSVTAAKLAAGSVTTAKIAPSAVGSTELANDAVTSTKIATGAVTSSRIGAAAVTSDKLASSAVTNAKLASMVASTLKGRDSSGTGAPQDLTAAQVRAILNVSDGAEVNVNADWNATSGDARILNKPTTFPPSTHNHDDRYYTETEVNSLLNAKASLAGASFTGNVGIGVPSPLANLHVNGSLRASSLTDGTTTKTMTQVLSGLGGASSLSSLSDVAITGTVAASSFLLYAGGKWTNSVSAGLLPLGTAPSGGWAPNTVGAAINQKAPTASPTFTGNATVTASSGVPLTVTNTGVGNSFVVNDQSGDVTPFVVNAIGRVGVGVASPASELHVNGTVRCDSVTDGTNTATIASLVASSTNARRATHIDQQLTPTSATAGTSGQIHWDDNFIYVRTTSGWKRAQLWGLTETPVTSYLQVKLTQAQYDAIVTKDPNTLYVIVP